MRVAVNSMPLIGEITGVGNYLYGVASELKALSPDTDYSYFYGNFTKEFRCSDDMGGRSSIKDILRKIPMVSTIVREAKIKMSGLHLETFDIYFEPNFIPLDIRAKKNIVTVHDFSFHLYPEWLPKDRASFFKKHFYKRVKKADVIIFPSEYIRGQAEEILKDVDARVVVIPHGYGRYFTPNGDKHADKCGYVLFVGAIEPRKNLLNLLRAYQILQRSVREHFNLLLVGFKGWGNDEVMRLLGKLEGNVRYLGYVDNEELARLYRGASCFAYPSLYEGFGIPPLEAMASGCPTVVSNTASLPEVCGDAVRYVDPESPESIAEGIEDVLTDEELRMGLIKKGIQRTGRFSWERSAKEHLKVFYETINE
jgi:glycosyltransferase involved in cell wall biosynthesis